MSRIRALSRKPRRYILRADRGTENPPVFIIRSAPYDELLDIEAEIDEKYPASSMEMTVQYSKAQVLSKQLEENPDGNVEISDDMVKTFANAERALKRSQRHKNALANAVLARFLDGWERVPVEEVDEREQAVVVDLEYSKENIPYLAPEIRLEIADEIMGVLRENDTKDALSPSSPGNGSESMETTGGEIKKNAA